MIALSWLIYLPLQVLFIPVTAIGILLVAYKQVYVSKKLGLSQTAIEVINARWTMHVFGMRTDEPTVALAAALPNTSLLGLWLCLFPLWVKYKISGRHAIYPRKPEEGAEAIADILIARTLYIDRIVDRVAADVEQFVLLGAGYDSRAYGALRRPRIAYLELDQSSMQQHKLATLEAAGVANEHVKYISVDFATENAIEKLVQAGFDATKKTLFLWEGVTLYLSEDEVRMMLQQIRTAAAPGSVLLADVYGQRFIDFGNRGNQGKALEQTGEGLKFGLDFSEEHERVLKDFVQSEAMSVGETFFLGRSSDKGPFIVVAEIIV